MKTLKTGTESARHLYIVLVKHGKLAQSLGTIRWMSLSHNGQTCMIE